MEVQVAKNLHLLSNLEKAHSRERDYQMPLGTIYRGLLI
jgi:hypothetical protein